MKLWLKIIIALCAGVACGVIVGKDFSETYLLPVGTTFLNMVNMLVMLLVFSSMTVGVTSIHDPKKLGRVGLKSLFYYLSTTVASILVGITFANIMQPGKGVKLASSGTVQMGELPNLSEILTNIIPTNPIQAMAEGNVLQVIIFSIFFGIAINFSGKKAKPLLDLLKALADVMYKLTDIVMQFAPIGVFSMMAWVAGSYGLQILQSLGYYLLCNYLACLFHVVFVYGSILLFVTRLNPINFIKGMSDAIVFAFSTSSSSATLPVSLHCVQENLGVSKNMASFILPLGATVNMNGAAIAQAISAIFIAQAYGIELSNQSIVMLVVTATLSAVGAAGIPGTTFVMLSVVLSSVGLPLSGIALIAGVDRIREMVSTAVNILGDAVVAVVVAQQERELDIEQYNYGTHISMEHSDS